MKFVYCMSVEVYRNTLKPHLHALNFWHRADDFKAWHSQFSTCKRIGPTFNVAPLLKILGVPTLPPRGSLSTGKQGTVPKIWCVVPIFLACVNGVLNNIWTNINFFF